MIGQRFGQLVVTHRAQYSATNGAILWICVCDCGRNTMVRGSDLRSANTRSCGCSRIPKNKGRRRTYGSWYSAVRRCTNPDDAQWYLYGGRGITICAEWLSFENFHADMGDRPPGLTLERRDNEKGYNPENCYWASPYTQAQNRRTCHLLTYNGQTLTVTAWARILGVSPPLIDWNLRRGRSIDEIVARYDKTAVADAVVR